MALQVKSLSSAKTSNGYTLILELTENSISIDNNTSPISYKLILKSGSYNFSQFRTGWSIAFDGTVISSQNKSTAKQISIAKNSSVTIVSGTTTVKHNDNGEKTINVAFSIDQNKTSYSAGPISVSGQSMVLTTIPRATVPAVPKNITMGQTVTIKLPRASNNFTHTLSYSFGTLSGNIASNATTEAKWLVPTSLSGQIPTSMSGNGTVTCKTYDGNKLVGTASASFTASVPEYKPTISEVDISESIVGIAERFNAFVQRRSQLRINTSAAGQYGSQINSVQVNLEGTVYNGADITTNAVVNSGDIPVSVVVTDSRGRTNTVEKSVSVLPYSPPTVNLFNADRAGENGEDDDEGEYMAYTLDYQISSVNSLNTALYQIQYKPDETSSWSILIQGNDYSKIVNGISDRNILDPDLAYNVRVLLKDFFETVYVNIADISTGFTLVDYDESGKGLSIGQVSKGYGVHIYLPIDIYDRPLADFITEVGVSGTWLYRKYASGYAECWTTVNVVADVTVKWENVYHTGELTELNIKYPFVFETTPILNTSIACAGWNGWLSSSGSNSLPTNENTGDLEIFRASRAEKAHYSVNYHAIGKLLQNREDSNG